MVSLVSLLVRWSEARDKIAPALLVFQRACDAVSKGETAKLKGVSKGGKEYELTYAYADIADCIAHARPHLLAAGLVVVQPPAGTSICTTVLHESGQFFESTLELATPARPDDPQAWGSVITYFRRYAFLATLGIAADDDDDDGAAARVVAGAGRAPAPPAAPPTTRGGGTGRGGTRGASAPKGEVPEEIVLPIGKLKGRTIGSLADDELARERDFYLTREADEGRRAAWRAEDRNLANACAAALANRAAHDAAKANRMPQTDPYAGSGRRRGALEEPDNNAAWGIGNDPAEEYSR